MKKLPLLIASCCAAVWAASLSVSTVSLGPELKRIEASSVGSARRTWDDLKETAAAQGLKLPQAGEGKNVLHSYKGRQHWHLFFVELNGLDASNSVAIQRVRRKESTWEGDGRKDSVDYAVFAHRLQGGRLKRLDQHSTRPRLGSATKREITWECEIGLGSLTAQKLDASNWPFENNKLSKKVQGYSEDKSLYEEVKFTQSQRFTYTVTMTSEKSTLECKELGISSQATP